MNNLSRIASIYKAHLKSDKEPNSILVKKIRNRQDMRDKFTKELKSRFDTDEDYENYLKTKEYINSYKV